MRHQTPREREGKLLFFPKGEEDRVALPDPQNINTGLNNPSQIVSARPSPSHVLLRRSTVDQLTDVLAEQKLLIKKMETA